MDEVDYLSTIKLLTHNQSLEGRLKLVLETTRSFLNLDICSILLVPDSGSDFYIISCGDNVNFVQDDSGKYISAEQSDSDSEDDLIVLRRNKADADYESYGFSEVDAQKLHIKSVAGADFRLHQNLEVRLRLTRNQGRGEFSSAEINLVEKVIASIRTAICGAIHEQHRAVFDLSALKLLTRLRIAMFTLNQKLEILEKSALAEELLEKTRAYRGDDSLLTGRSREYQIKLDNAIEELKNNDELRYKIVDIIVTDKGEQYTLVIAKVVSQNMLFAEGNFLVFIFSSSEGCIDPGNLLNLWQISPAEKKVLAAIARYDNIKKVAIELKISPNTAKAQLKSAYRKLGVGSKMMLMKRLNLLKNIEALMGEEA